MPSFLATKAIKDGSNAVCCPQAKANLSQTKSLYSGMCPGLRPKAKTGARHKAPLSLDVGAFVLLARLSPSPKRILAGLSHADSGAASMATRKGKAKKFRDVLTAAFSGDGTGMKETRRASKSPCLRYGDNGKVLPCEHDLSWYDYFRPNEVGRYDWAAV